MRKIQITIFVLLLMIGGIGLAFAIFSFNDPISKTWILALNWRNTLTLENFGLRTWIITDTAILCRMQQDCPLIILMTC